MHTLRRARKNLLSNKDNRINGLTIVETIQMILGLQHGAGEVPRVPAPVQAISRQRLTSKCSPIPPASFLTKSRGRGLSGRVCGLGMGPKKVLPQHSYTPYWFMHLRGAGDIGVVAANASIPLPEEIACPGPPVLHGCLSYVCL